MSGLSNELQVAWRRAWAGRLVPLLLLAATLLIVLVSLASPGLGGPEHRELDHLRGIDEVIFLVLEVGAILVGYRLVVPDLDGQFESLGRAGTSTPLSFAAGRSLAGAGALLALAAALGVLAVLLDFNGRHPLDELLRVTVLAANALPLLLLTMALTCLIGRFMGPLGALLLQSWGTEAAYDRGALADGFILSTPLYAIEQGFAWLAPWPLVDRLVGIELHDQSEVLRQFPVRQGHAVWGSDLTAVSAPLDVVHYSIYLLAVATLFLLACRYRGSQARSRPQLGHWFRARNPTR